jgi:hypothetical protein
VPAKQGRSAATCNADADQSVAGILDGHLRSKHEHSKPLQNGFEPRTRQLKIEGVVQAQDAEKGQHASFGAALTADLSVCRRELAHVVRQLPLQEVGRIGTGNGDQSEMGQSRQGALRLDLGILEAYVALLIKRSRSGFKEGFPLVIHAIRRRFSCLFDNVRSDRFGLWPLGRYDTQTAKHFDFRVSGRPSSPHICGCLP